MILQVAVLKAQDHKNNVGNIKEDYSFLNNRYDNVFSYMPSILTQWRYENWSYIGADYDFKTGDFRNLQEYNRYSLLNIKTESVHKLENTNWIFYGKFHYANGQADSVGYNLAYTIGRNGSPNYLFQRKNGVWSLQNYQFDVTASNRISNKFSLGLRILYNGDLAYRIIDTRNSQTSLITKVLTSLSWHIGERSSISLGIGTDRVKSQPSLSNKYQHFSTDLRYNRYLNAGLGSYLKNIDYTIQITNNNKNAELQWLYQSNNSSYSAIYQLFSGNETFVNKYITNISREHRIIQYNYIENRGVLATLNKVAGSMLYNTVNVNFTKGNGSLWNEVDSAYVDNYVVDIMDVGLQSTLYTPSSFFNRFNLYTSLISENKFDRSYAYQFNYTNLSFGLDAEFLVKFNIVRVGFMVGAAYNMNLSYQHSPGAAANNIFKLWIGDPLMSYLTCNYLELPGYLKFEIPFKNNLAELLITGTYRQPVKLNYDIGATFTNKDNFSIFNISLKYYF